MPADNEYTLSGVMRFLQLEWQRNERDRIQWDIERAEMRSRLAKMDADRQTLARTVLKYEPALKVLQQARGPVPEPNSPAAAPLGEPKPLPSLSDAISDTLNLSLNLNGTQSHAGAATNSISADTESDDADVEKLAAVRQYLDQCINEVGFILDQSGVSQETAAPPPAASRPPYGAMRRLKRTLAESGQGVMALAPVTSNTWAIGTDLGEVSLWTPQTAFPAIPTSLSPEPTDLEQAPPQDRTASVAGHSGSITALKVQGTEGYSGASDGSVTVWELLAQHPPRKIFSFQAHAQPITSLALLPERNVLATASEDGAISFWDTETLSAAPLAPVALTTKRYLMGAGVAPTALVPTKTAGESTLLVGYNHGFVVLADSLGALRRNVFRPSRPSALTLLPPSVTALIPVDATIYVGQASGSIMVVDAESGELKEEVIAHTSAVTSLSVSPGGDQLISTGADGQVNLWLLILGALTYKGRLLGHDALETSGARASSWTTSGAVIGAADGLVRLYNLDSP